VLTLSRKVDECKALPVTPSTAVGASARKPRNTDPSSERRSSTRVM